MGVCDQWRGGDGGRLYRRNLGGSPRWGRGASRRALHEFPGLGVSTKRERARTTALAGRASPAALGGQAPGVRVDTSEARQRGARTRPEAKLRDGRQGTHDEQG